MIAMKQLMRSIMSVLFSSFSAWQTGPPRNKAVDVVRRFRVDQTGSFHKGALETLQVTLCHQTFQCGLDFWGIKCGYFARSYYQVVASNSQFECGGAPVGWTIPGDDPFEVVARLQARQLWANGSLPFEPYQVSPRSPYSWSQCVWSASIGDLISTCSLLIRFI